MIDLILFAALGFAASHEDFLERLRPLCGQAFAGKVVSPPDAEDADFAGKALVMHVRDCSADAIRIPFHVGEDRSRTWVVTRTESGLRLKHDHRHPDGSEDALTQYGGDAATAEAKERQEFPADAESKGLFARMGRPQSMSNVWALELREGQLVYELARPGRLFRVAFDLDSPLPPPPAPWGSTGPSNNR